MKINKIICDACDQEVDVERDNGLAAFEYIQALPKIAFGPNVRDPQSEMKLEREITKTSFDLCKKCADKVVDFIKEKKKETEKENKEVEKDSKK